MALEIYKMPFNVFYWPQHWETPYSPSFSLSLCAVALVSAPLCESGWMAFYSGERNVITLGGCVSVCWRRVWTFWETTSSRVTSPKSQERYPPTYIQCCLAMQIDWIGSNVIFDALSEANKILFISFILGIIREVWAAHISKSQQLKLCVYLDTTVFDIFIYLCDLS